MKRPSRIVLTCMATTGALTGAGFTISSIATAATSTVANPATPVSDSAKRAELQRQSLLLRSQIDRLENAIDGERLRARPSAAASPALTTEYAQAPAPAAPLSAAPAPSWSPPQYVPATAAPVAAAPVAAAPVAVPTTAAPTPPPVHTTTGASGAAAGGTEPSEGGSDD